MRAVLRAVSDPAQNRRAAEAVAFAGGVLVWMGMVTAKPISDALQQRLNDTEFLGAISAATLIQRVGALD